MEIDLQLEKAVEAITVNGAKKVLVQLADGLKPKADIIQAELEKTNAEIFLWAGTCFGACDIPNVEGFDLVIQFGHSEWKN